MFYKKGIEHTSDIQLLRLGFTQKPARAARKFPKLVFILMHSLQNCPTVEKTGIIASLEAEFPKIPVFASEIKEFILVEYSAGTAHNKNFI